MSGVPMPGSYPDSMPPTPDESMLPEHHQRQRNKLQKPDGPRGHRYTDSGVGMPDPEPTQSYSQGTKSHWIGPAEAVGGGTYARERAQPPAPLESIRHQLDTTTPTKETEHETMFRGSRDKGMAAGVIGGMAGSDRQENTEPTRRSPQQSGDSAPYWGDLPTGTDGGVYNTVAGHGSAVDDHMPPKSASSVTSVIPGHVANYPRGGVYNTVTGHGSQDDQLRPHSQPRGIDDSTATSTNMPATRGPLGDGMIPAPLSDIPEERQRTSRHATFADQPTQPSGLLPEPIVRDDVRLGKATSREAPYTDSAPNPDPLRPQREFPLTTAPVGNRNEQRDSAPQSRHGAAAAAVAAAGAGATASQYVGKRKEGNTAADQNQTYSKSPDQGNGSQVAGGVVTGKRLSPGQGAPMENTRSSVDTRRSQEEEPPKGEKRHSKILGIFHRSRDDSKEDTTKARRNSVNERYTAPAREDVAVVNPNPLRKQSRSEAPIERKRLSSSANADTDERPGHGMEKAAAGAAAGAGVFGLAHHKKGSVSEKPQDTTSTARPLTAGLGGAGPARDVPHRVEGVSTPFERPREPPMIPQEANSQAAGAVGQPSNYNAAARGTSSGVSHGLESGSRGTTANEPGSYSMLAAGTTGQPSNYNAPARGTSSGSSYGAESGPSGTTANEPGNYSMLAAGATGQPSNYNAPATGTSSGVSQGPESGSRGTAANEPGKYNMLAAGAASGVAAAAAGATARHHMKTKESGDYNTLDASPETNRRGIASRDFGDQSATRQDVVASDAGDYNLLKSSGTPPTAERAPGGSMLAAGIPSGIKSDSGNPTSRSADRSGTKTNTETSDGEPEYNVLQSGTPSGVKYKPKSPREYSSMLYPDAPPGTGPADITTRAQDPKDLPLPPQAANTRGLNTEQSGHTFAAAPLPSHVRTSHPNPSQESVPGVTTYSHPEAARNMSPEVMPDAYAASAPGHTHGQAQSYSQGESQGTYDYPPTQQTAKGMSPAVMPAAYLASAPGHSHSHNQSQDQGSSQTQNQYDYPPTQQTAKGMSPAVMPAAYTEAAPHPAASQSQSQGQGQEDSIGSGLYPHPELQQQQQHSTKSTTTDRGFNPAAPAVAAAATSWMASGAGKKSSAGQPGLGGTGVGAGAGSRQAQGGVGAVMHRCKHCGEEDDIGGYVERVMEEMRRG